jgi:hypothetical protein
MKKNISEASAALRQQALESRLAEIDMTTLDMSLYQTRLAHVQPFIHELSNILAGAQSKLHESRSFLRQFIIGVWLRNQSEGEMDERRLVDGLTGDRNIYKRRGQQPPTASLSPQLPKVMHFAFDLSASMLRFNPTDGRLERSLEVALMCVLDFVFSSQDHGSTAWVFWKVQVPYHWAFGR